MMSELRARDAMPGPTGPARARHGRRPRAAPVAGEAPTVSEELRTIATCVVGFVDLLQSARATACDRALYLGVLHEQAVRLARLSESLADEHPDLADRPLSTRVATVT